MPGDLEEPEPEEPDLVRVGAEALAFAMDLETEAEAEFMVFLTAEVADEALLFSLLPLNSFSNRDAAVLGVLALAPWVRAGAEHSWSAGKRCEGQNCSRHCCKSESDLKGHWRKEGSYCALDGRE